MAFHEVEAPDVVAVPGTQPDTRAVGEPEPAALGLLLRDFQPLTAPDPLNPVLANLDPGVLSRAVTRR